MIKLPDNPKDRKKVIGVLCLVALAIAYAAVTFGLLPYLSSVKVRKNRAAELEDFIQRAKKDVDAINRNMAQNNTLVSELLSISETQHYILRPNLGNYLLVASTILNEAATGLRVSIDSITEIPLATPTALEKKAREKQPAADAVRFAPYTANVSLTGGLHALTNFLYRLESNNPYVAVTRLVVMEQGQKDPENHVVNLYIQWPIWVDSDYPRRLEAEQIADEERQ